MAVVQESEGLVAAKLDWLTTTVRRNTRVPRCSPPKETQQIFLPSLFSVEHFICNLNLNKVIAF